MTVHVTRGCICGDSIDLDFESLADWHIADDLWTDLHSGPGHGPCGADEARRIAKRERVKG